jgi:hypothetical protein
MFPEEILSQGKFPLQKSRGGFDGIGRDRREDEPSGILGHVDLAAGLEPQFCLRFLGTKSAFRCAATDINCSQKVTLVAKVRNHLMFLFAALAENNSAENVSLHPPRTRLAVFRYSRIKPQW